MPGLFNILISNMKHTPCPTVRNYVDDDKSVKVVEALKVMATIQRDPEISCQKMHEVQKQMQSFAPGPK